jgi:DNA polymerase-1
MKYLLIDGNNLAIRSAFANQELKNSEGIASGVHYGFFNSLVALKQVYGDSQILISWDSKSKRRMEESQLAVEKSIIKSTYKANRKKDEQPQPLLDFFEQAPFLKKAIEQTGIPQIKIDGYETDDVINSYCKKLSKDNAVVAVTSDFDYLQLLDDNVSIYDGMKQKEITKKSFIEEYKIQPSQYVDVGALCGDTGDNIFGITGWGDKTALEAIQEHGSWEGLYKYLHKTYDGLRTQYPDLSGDEFKKLEGIITKSGKAKYPEITVNTPFTGVALAIEDKKIKDKIPKTTIMALMFEERVKLAFSLKKMDIIEELPEIKQGEFNKDRLLEYFDYYDIKTLKDSVDVLERQV